MKKYAKIAGIAIAALLLLLLIVPFFINADSFRPTVQASVQDALGRNVQVGKLSFSLFSGSLSADGITIADDPNFSTAPFVTAKSLKIKVQVKPLIFSRELHIDAFTLEKPEVALISNTEGRWNYASLGGKDKPSPAPTAGTPASPRSNFAIDKVEISAGRISVSEVPAKMPPSIYSDVNLTVTDVSSTSKMPFTLSAKAPRGGTIKAEGEAGPMNPSDASLTPLQVSLKSDAVEIAGLAPTAGISGLLETATKFSSDGRQAHLEGSGQIKNLTAVAEGVPSKEPLGINYNTNYAYAGRQGTLAVNATVRKNTAKLSGPYEMRNSVILHLNLNGQDMSVDDLEALLPAFGIVLPSGGSLRGGTLSANLNIVGPMEQLIISGPISLSNTKLAGFDLGSKMAGLGSLAGVKTGSETTIQALSTNVSIASTSTRADNINLVIPSLGTLNGSGTIANKNLNFKLVAKVQTTGGGLLGAAGGSAGAKSIPFAIQGTTSNPKFVPDAGAMVESAIADQVNHQIGGKSPQGISGALSGLLGGKKKH